MPTADHADLQRDQVDTLRRKQTLTDANVAQAFLAVPRHVFLPQRDPRSAYHDEAIALKTGAHGEIVSSASQPGMMAIMLEQLDLRAGMNALEIGTATGFNAALIKGIVGEGGRVVSLEIDSELCQQARGNLLAAGLSDVLVVNRDAACGYAPGAPYDRIIATASLWDLPKPWLEQLTGSGKLVAPIWLDGFQVSAAFGKQSDGSWLSRDNRPCAFVPFLGQAAGRRAGMRIGDSLEILADDTSRFDKDAIRRLLSEEQWTRELGGHLAPEDFWNGFQLYVMLRAPLDCAFAAYALPSGESRYGLEGNGILLASAGSLAFAPYAGGGRVHCFGDQAAFQQMRSLCQGWRTNSEALYDRLRLRLIARSHCVAGDCPGKIFTRRHHDLQVWLS